MGRVRLSEAIAPAYYALHADVRQRAHGEYWLSGGRGSGKSSFVSLEVLLTLLRQPEVNAAVFRKVGATLRESVFEQMLWAAGRLGIAGLVRPQFTPLELEYLPTGQRVLFRGADDPMKVKSIKLAQGRFGCLWFEELTEFSGMETVRSIKASVVRGGDAVTFMSYNPPESVSSWVNAEALRGMEGRLLHRSDYRDMPRGWLGDGFIADAEALRAADERAYRHMYLGECVGTGMQVFANLELRSISGEELESFDRMYCGLDFGFAVDPDAFVRLYFDRRRRLLFFVDEFYAVRTPLDTLAREVSRRMSDGEHVTCDSADPRMIEELRMRGVRALSAKKGPGSVERGMRQLQELTGIVIDPRRCPNAAREFSAYEYGRDRDGAAVAVYPDRNNHAIDAARYAMEGVALRREARAVDRARLGF